MGETLQQALAREIHEELDAEIEIGELLHIVEWDYPNFHLTMYCYWCVLTSESLHLNEHESARWLGKEELHSVQWPPADISVLEDIAEHL